MYALNLDIKNGIFEHIIFIYLFVCLFSLLKHIWHIFETKPKLQKIKTKSYLHRKIYKILLEPYYYNAKFENECTLVKKYIIVKKYISFDH